MTIMRFALFFTFSRQGNSFPNVTDAFFLGLRFDLRTISIIMLVILALGSINALHPFRHSGARRFWITLLTIVVFAMIFFYVVDFAHYAYLGQRLNASILNYLADAGISMNMVWQSYPVIKLVLLLIVATILIVLLIRVGYRRINKTSPVVSRLTRIVSFIVLFLILAFFIFGQFKQFPLRWSDAFGLGNDYKANLALNPFETFFNTLKFRDTYDEKKVKELYPVIASYLGLKNTYSSQLNFERTIIRKDSISSNKPNIILVICESFSAYKSSMWGNPLNTTPFFDSLSRNGIFFDRCFTPSYGTARGVWATITGIPDVENAQTTASRNPAAVDQQTIINDFKNYQKFYFIGGSPSWANIQGLLKNNIEGLRLFDQEDFNVPKLDVWGISDKNLFLQANHILSEQKQPFFAVIQTADNHRPYSIPKEDQQQFVKRNVSADSLKKFGFESLDEFNAFRYTDFCYQKFMTAANNENYFNNTIFIFIGDHGIPGDVGDMLPRSWTEQRLASEHVPLLFYAPHLFSPKRLNIISSQIDVLPTIAGLCKISYTNSTLGRDLLDSTFTEHAAFIFDPQFNQFGTVKDHYFYRRQMKTDREELVSIDDNKPVKELPNITTVTDEMRLLTTAIYETSKYLLLNNKKKKIR